MRVSINDHLQHLPLEWTPFALACQSRNLFGISNTQPADLVRCHRQSLGDFFLIFFAFQHSCRERCTQRGDVLPQLIFYRHRNRNEALRAFLVVDRKATRADFGDIGG